MTTIDTTPEQEKVTLPDKTGHALHTSTIGAEIHNEIKSAIDDNNFEMYYQPITDLQSGNVIGLEALVRWIHPERGIIPPNKFIGVAEDLALINKLGDWIIREVCLTIREWMDQKINVPRIAINISPKQLQEASFAERLANTLAEFNINPHRITLEITENLLLNHGEEMAALLQKIKALGFNLSLDDFGTGYSALSYLKYYPFDYVKIAQEFIQDIPENSSDAAITNASIAMAHSMGIKVIAEGVERPEQCEFLSKNMCDCIQGFLVSKPLPANQATKFMASNYCLPENLRRFTSVSRTILLVDDEAGILSSLKRLFRRDGYEILTANSGPEGLEILKNHSVDVIMSDQRMPMMTGVEFLQQAKLISPNTIRLILSGYTELQSVTDAINEGAVYKFLTKPWIDQQLRDQISEAFKQKELADENHRLELEIRKANQELAMANRHLHEKLKRKERQLNLGETSLDIAQSALRLIPVPILGVDSEGMITFTNTAAEVLFSSQPSLLGENIDHLLPNFTLTATNKDEGVNFALNISGFDHLANLRTIDIHAKSAGKVITFFKNSAGGVHA